MKKITMKDLVKIEVEMDDDRRNPKRRRRSIGPDLVAGLTELRDTLRAGKPVKVTRVRRPR